MRNILVLSAIIALGNLKPNISWHSVTVWILLVLNNFIKNRLTDTDFGFNAAMKDRHFAS